jgi:hypothetical protein
MLTEVFAPLMFPSSGSYQHGPPLLRRVRVPAVPRLPRSYWALRLPVRLRPRTPVSLARDLPRCKRFSYPGRAGACCRATVGDWSPALHLTGSFRGASGISQVTGPSSSHVPWSCTPPGAVASCPSLLATAVAFRHRGTLGSRDYVLFEAAFPTAHVLAHLRIADVVTAIVARLRYRPAGLSFDRTGFAPAGWLLQFSSRLRRLLSHWTSLAWSHPYSLSVPND